MYYLVVSKCLSCINKLLIAFLFTLFKSGRKIGLEYFEFSETLITVNILYLCLEY